MRFDVVIAGGLLVTSQRTMEANLGIISGRIAAIANEPLAGDEVIDARHRLVLPGAVDLHIHLPSPDAIVTGDPTFRWKEKVSAFR